VSACQKYDVKIKAYKCDVTDESNVRSIFTDIERDIGPVEYSDLDQTHIYKLIWHSILVNNAGTFLGRPMSMTSFEPYWKTVNVNFKSVR